MSETQDVQEFLAQLEAERDRLDTLIAEMRKRLGIATDGDRTSVSTSSVPAGSPLNIVPGRIRADEFFRLSIREAITKYLEIMRQPQSPKQIADGLKVGGVLSNAKHFYANVFTELKRMRARGLVVNTPSGWAVADWYPNKPKQLVEMPKKRKKAKSRTKANRTSRSASTAMDSPKRQATGGGWREFLTAALQAGKTMQQASQEWKEQGAAGGK